MAATGAVIAFELGLGATTTAAAATIGGFALTAGGVFVATAINIGLAYGASRLINGNPRDQRGANANQGTRVQLAPASDIKIPVIYGTVHQQGILTDAHISNDNKTMTYVLVLSEMVNAGNWSMGNIYWNDQLLTFKADGFTVLKGTSNGEDNTKLDGLVRIWAWAGATPAAYQIHGPTIPVNAYSIIPTADINYAMTNLVFAVVQLDYSAENGITGLPPITFEITNDLTDPGLVWTDYLTNTVYGANIPIEEVNTSSAARLSDLSNTIPPNQLEPWPYSTSTTTTSSFQVRYSINGIFNTGESVKNNLDKIDIASASWTTYDYQLGQWSTIPNYTIDSGVLATAFQFTDDNIIGDINVTATNLEDLYNSVEVGFADRNNRDQTSYYSSSTSVALRNDLEPDNQLRLNTDLCNNALQAGRIGQIELRQSRVDLLINFTADYSALSVNAGDVVKVTNAVYGFNNALFRVTRVQEIEGDDGMIVAGITALQYDATVYSDTDLVDYNTPPITDIPLFGGSTALAPPSKPVVTDDPDLAQFVVSSTVDPNNYPVNRVEFYVSTTSTGDFYTLSVSISNFNPGDTIDIPVSYYGFINGDYYFKTRVGSGNLLSDYSPVSDVFVFDNGNIVSGGGVGSAVNAVYTENILINNVIPLQPPYYLALTEGKDGAYYPLDADDGLLWDADNNQLSIGGGIHLTPLAAQPAVYSTGTIAVANRTGWDPVGITTGTAYPVFYNGQIWTQMGGKAVQAQYQSTATQVINTTTNGYKMTLDTVDFQYGITQNNGTITLSGPGIYNLQWSGQFQNSNSSIHDAYVWLRQNGVDVPGSNGILTLPGKHAGIDGSIIAGWNYFIQTTSTSETVELYWGVEVSAITLVNLGPQSSPTRPGTASLIVTVFKVSS